MRRREVLGMLVGAMLCAVPGGRGTARAATPAPNVAKANLYDALIHEAAVYYTLPAALLKAVIAVESHFEPAAVSPVGAMGLMQLMPATAKRMQVSDPFHPWHNIYGGARYLRILANRFGGDLRRTLAAYNAGPEAVERAGGVPPYAETQHYVKRVLALYRHYLTHSQGDGLEPALRPRLSPEMDVPAQGAQAAASPPEGAQR